MAEHSNIEWTDATFNLVWGCEKVSPACRSCYAEAFAHRLGLDIWGADKPRRTFGAKYWAQPLRWNRAAALAGVRRRVFCSSMADVFEEHATVANERIKLFRLIEQTPALDWLLLTKRPQNVMRHIGEAQATAGASVDARGWLARQKNVWLGTTVENQATANERIPHLLSIPVRIRFLSCEPLLEAVNLRSVKTACGADALACSCSVDCAHAKIDQVIVGGESGNGKEIRPFEADWALDLLRQCREANVPFFMKQFGSVYARKHGWKDAKGGDINEFPPALRVREFPPSAPAIGPQALPGFAMEMFA